MLPSISSVYGALRLRLRSRNKPSVYPHYLEACASKSWLRPRRRPFPAFIRLYTLLRSKVRSMTSYLTSSIESKDRVTTKLLIRLQNGTSVEAVIMRYDTRLGKYNGKPRLGGVRSTLCVSSQVGCKMGCKFCATGSMGFKSNLSSGEIVEQLVHANQFSYIRNVVFMGMGEPLNNYSALVEAIQVMTEFPFQLSPKRITVSTVGIIHAINKLHDDLPNVNLAVSLHAPDQDIRCQIMPAARAFPLGKLMEALQGYQNKSDQISSSNISCLMESMTRNSMLTSLADF